MCSVPWYSLLYFTIWFHWKIENVDIESSPRSYGHHRKCYPKPFIDHSLDKRLVYFTVSNKSICPNLLCARQGSGALCDGSQQVSGSGLGLPDDEAEPNGGGCGGACETAALHPAKPRLPETAQSPGHQVTRGEAGTKERHATTIAHKDNRMTDNICVYYLNVSSKSLSGISKMFFRFL